jgi:large subunit ribosomal protein L29
MKASELRQKTTEELNVMLGERVKEQFNLRMQKATGQLAKPAQVKMVRREMARIHTILNEKARAKS